MTRPKNNRWAARSVEVVGRKTITFLEASGGALRMFFQAIALSFSRPFSFRRLLKQLEMVGLNSLPVVILTAIFTGIILAVQGTYQIAKFGASTYVGGIMGITMLRELGPVLTALVVSGRVGAGITAELGTMNVTEQIDALRSLAANPIKYLVVPRLWAGIIMLPALTVVADVVGVFGGWAVSATTLGIPTQVFFHHFSSMVSFSDLFLGLAKTVVFGIIITIVGCYQGFTTTGGAEGVGFSTTKSVVISSISVLLSDAIMTSMFI
jgi:phospholipid/cholesterol/gamma-HCH transport system permease protein